MATPSSNPTSDPVTRRRVAKPAAPRSLETRGGQEVPLVSLRRREGAGVADLDLGLEVVDQVDADVGLQARVDLHLRCLEPSLVGVAGVDEGGGPQLPEIRR